MTVYLLCDAGHVRAIVSNKSLAEQWKESNPQWRGYREFSVDGDVAGITRDILSEAARLSNLPKARTP